MKTHILCLFFGKHKKDVYKTCKITIKQLSNNHSHLKLIAMFFFHADFNIQPLLILTHFLFEENCLPFYLSVLARNTSR